jgi:hypothetical protein
VELQSHHLGICHIIILAFVLRALLPIFAYLHTSDATIFYLTDTGRYVLPAQELISHHRFFSHGAPDIFDTPGYPLLLIPGLVLGHLLLVTISLQVLLSCFTVYMVYRTAQLLFSSESIAITAAAFYTIEPLSVLYPGLILTETLFTALFTLWLYLLLRYLIRPTLHDLLYSGIFLTASMYVRPIGIYLPVIIASGLLVWIFTSAQQNKGRLLVHAAGFLIVCLGLIVPWQVRNREETGYFGFCALAPSLPYFFFAASVLAVQQQVSFDEMQRRLGYLDDHAYFALHPEQKAWPIKLRLEYMSNAARDILLKNPLTYARIHIEGMERVMLDPGTIELLTFFGLNPMRDGLPGTAMDAGLLKTAGILFMKYPLVFWSSMLLLPLQLLFLSCACLVLFSRRLIRQPQIIAAIAIAMYFITISGGPHGASRYRHPVMPIICILAGYELCLMWSRLMGVPRSPAVVASSVTSVLAFKGNSC